MSNPPPGNSADHNANWPKGWFPNMPAPEELMADYQDGDPTETWAAKPGSMVGPQPKGSENPKGTIPGVPAFTIK